MVLIGDTRIDAETARAAGCRFVWGEWGFAPAAERADLARYPHAASVRELAALLAGRE
jgi:phosphoglycolate phosphatase-like HAD superfamily hydrolase